jgi:hypothetical protein
MPGYPANWKLCEPEKAAEGYVIPLHLVSEMPPGACTNCRQQAPGSMFGFLLDAKGLATRYFRFGKEGQIYRGRMITAPCPRCGAADRMPLTDGGNSKAKYWDN